MVFTKGAIERVLEACTHITWAAGSEPVPLDSNIQNEIPKDMDALAKEGLRVLALACCQNPPGTGMVEIFWIIMITSGFPDMGLGIKFLFCRYLRRVAVINYPVALGGQILRLCTAHPHLGTGSKNFVCCRLRTCPLGVEDSMLLCRLMRRLEVDGARRRLPPLYTGKILIFLELMNREGFHAVCDPVDPFTPSRNIGIRSISFLIWIGTLLL